MKTLTIEEIKEKLQNYHPGSWIKVSWISDVIPVSTYTDPETGKTTTLTVTALTEAVVRMGIKNYAKIKSIAEVGEVASRTHTIGEKTVVSRKREPWFKHSTTIGALCYHKNDEELSENDRRWYLQMYKSHAKDIMTKESHPIVTKYVFMFGTADEEILTSGSTAKGDALLAKLAEMKPAHERPDEVWLKPISSIVKIGNK